MTRPFLLRRLLVASALVSLCFSILSIVYFHPNESSSSQNETLLMPELNKPRKPPNISETVQTDFTRINSLPEKSDEPPSRNSTPHEGWIYEPRNLGYFWKKMGDRPFMREFYPKLARFSRVLDVGARGYNRVCKELINSSVTEYYQVEPHPPNEVDNDGLLKCTVQEIKKYYPQYHDYFDVVLDFGVFGWDAVQKTFSVKDIEQYIDNIRFVLHQKGLWVVKVDTGWVDKEESFLSQHVLPYFERGAFDIYQSGHVVKNKFRFLFFYLKPEIEKESTKQIPVPTIAPDNRLLRTTKSPIQVENERPGTSDWVLSKPALNREIEGYTSKTSTQQGDSIRLYYNTQSHNVTIDVYRTGWYEGSGARLYLGPVTVKGISQVIPRPDRFGTVKCEWVDPFIIQTNNTWTTGVYIARMTESTNQTQSYAIFVVRDDKHIPDVTFQLPVNTYQAYNFWGGKSLYGWGSAGADSLPWGYHPDRGNQKAIKVSFHRPYARSNNEMAAYGNGAGEYFVNVQPLHHYPMNSSAAWNYNMVRWLERNHVDVSYITNVDAHVRLQGLPKPKLFLTQGHDEYWSWEMRDHVESMRDEGVHLAFLGSNTAFWQIRFEDIIEEEPTSIVCYRWPKQDPVKDHLRTTKFRQIRPEADMVGVQYILNGDPFDVDLVVASNASSHWSFQDTGVSDGSLLPGLLGYEVDGIRSPSLNIGNSTVPVKPLFETPVVNRLKKTLLCHGVIYTAPSGANVFSPGTMMWSWGLDDFNVRQKLRTSRLNSVVEIMTKNILRAAGVRI